MSSYTVGSGGGVSLSGDAAEPIGQTAAVGGSADAAPVDHVHPGPKAATIGGVAGSRYVIPGWYARLHVKINHAVGSLLYIPIYVGRTTTYDRIGVYVEQEQAGALARVGIYASAGSGEVIVPGALILDAGQLDESASGDEEIVISQQLTPGFYYLCYVADTGGVEVRGLHNDYACVPPVNGSVSALNGTPSGVVSTLSGNYSAEVAGGLSDPARTVTQGGSTRSVVVRLREA